MSKEVQDSINPAKFRLGGFSEPIYSYKFRRPGLVLGKKDVTVIGYICRPEGFVIGADGVRQSADRSLVIPDAQKVFGFQTKNISLAYAWCGHTVAWNADNPDEIFFDFEANTKPILNIASIMASNLSQFVEVIRSQFLAVLTQSNHLHAGWISNAPCSIARMLAVGYFGDAAFALSVRVGQENGVPQVRADLANPSNDLTVFSGFHIKKSDKLRRIPESVTDARNVIHEYVQQCVEDNPQCAGQIGGKVHVALVSPQLFQWIDPPHPIS